MLKIKEKNKKTDTLCVTWRKNLVRVLVGFRLGVRDTVRDPVEEEIILGQDPCIPSSSAWPFPSLKLATQTLSPLSSGSHLIFLSLMTVWVIIWNRVNDFYFRVIQVTILETLSKQSRKKNSFHNISEAATSPITLAFILMDSTEDPTFFKKPSIPENRTTGKFLTHPATYDSPPWEYFSKDRWWPWLILLYRSPLTGASQFYWPSPYLVKTFLETIERKKNCQNRFWTEKKIVFVWGKQCRRNGWKREEKG